MKIYAETERLILREVLDSDIKGMFELDSDPEVHRYLGNRPIKTMDQAQEAIDYIRMQYKERGIGRWAVIDKLSNEFIGWSGLKLNTEEESYKPGYRDFYDIGYRIMRRHWGKGYATESAKAAIDYAFKTMKTDTVYGITELGNEASHQVLLKLGLDFVEDYVFEKEKHEFQLRWYKIENS